MYEYSYRSKDLDLKPPLSDLSIALFCLISRFLVAVTIRYRKTHTWRDREIAHSLSCVRERVSRLQSVLLLNVELQLYELTFPSSSLPLPHEVLQPGLPPPLE